MEANNDKIQADVVALGWMLDQETPDEDSLTWGLMHVH